MKRILYTLGIIALVTGCVDNGGGVSGYIPGGPDKGVGPRPTNPTGNFENAAVEHNSNITGIYMRNANQVADFVNYRLNDWDEINPDFGSDISKADIATAALYLSDSSLTTDEISEHFADKTDLFHMAVYMIDNRLNRCFDTDVNSVECFTEWRDGHMSDFAKVASEIKNNAVVLDPTQSGNEIVLDTISNQKLTFIFKDGQINGITVSNADGTNATEYDNFFRHDGTDIETYAIQKFDYESDGKDIGLTYSDFGTYTINTYNINNEITESDTGLFAGGYESKQIKETDVVVPENGLSFSGSAVARVTSDKGDVPETKNFDGNAWLNMDATTGTVDITALFNGWYNVDATKKIGEQNTDFTFWGYSGNAYSQNFQFNAENADKRAELTGTMDVKYYGENPETFIPTEATGFATVDEGAGGVKMDMAFGVKK